ncbi:MAG TPA: hypothetical protein VLD67_08280, partial [Vicinamibacterales bacterium]|nr:hypothetical protein [Vicinamibacterales bacterium]
MLKRHRAAAVFRSVRTTWNVSFQRSIWRDTAIEIRYVGTRGTNQWSTLNCNAIRGENLVNNGFLDERRRAMLNLQANNC